MEKTSTSFLALTEPILCNTPLSIRQSKQTKLKPFKNIRSFQIYSLFKVPTFFCCGPKIIKEFVYFYIIKWLTKNVVNL